MKAARIRAQEEAERQKKVTQLKNVIASEESKFQDDSKRLEAITRDQTQRTQKLTSANFAITVKQGIFRKEMMGIHDKHNGRMSKLNTRIQELTTRKQELERNLEAFGLIEFETERLHRRLEELQLQQSEQEEKNKIELEELRKESFNTQMQLEHTNRQTMKELEEQYELRAFEEMRTESLNALQENERLQGALGKQSRRVVNLIEDQKNTYSTLIKSRIERDMLEASKALEDKQIGHLEKVQSQQEAQMKNMRVYILKLHKGLQNKKEAIEFSKGAHTQLEAMKKRYGHLKIQEQKARSRTLEIVRKELKKIHTERVRKMTKDHSLPLLKMMGVKTDDIISTGRSQHSLFSNATTANVSFKEALVPIINTSTSQESEESGSFMTTDEMSNMNHIWNASYQKGGVLTTY